MGKWHGLACEVRTADAVEREHWGGVLTTMHEEPTLGLPAIDRDYDTLLAHIQERFLADLE